MFPTELLTPAALLPIRWESSLVHSFIEASTSSFHNTTLGGGYFGRLLEVWGVEAPDGRSLWEARVVRRALPVLVVGLVLLWPRLGMVRCGLLLGMRRTLYPEDGRTVAAPSHRCRPRCSGRDQGGAEQGGGQGGRHSCCCFCDGDGDGNWRIEAPRLAQQRVWRILVEKRSSVAHGWTGHRIRSYLFTFLHLPM